MNVLLLMDDILKINLDVQELLHFLEHNVVPILLVISKHVFNRLIQDCLDVVDDYLKDSMMHF